MSEIRRLVRISAAGATTVIADLENGTTYQAVAQSVKIAPGQRRGALSESGRRYDGGWTVGEALENGTYEWKAVVSGTSEQDALGNAEAMVAPFEAAVCDLLLEWRPNGATTSNFYEVRGPATWTYELNADQLRGAYSLYVTVQVPIGPLVRQEAIEFPLGALTLPAAIELPPIPGTAPALADITLEMAETANPVWALVSWSRRPTFSLQGKAPFGILDAAFDSSPSGTGISTVSDSGCRSGSGLSIDAGASTGIISIEIDPATMPADDFSSDEYDLEVWARYKIPATVVSPSVVVSFSPRVLVASPGTPNGFRRYTSEFGSQGRRLTPPSSGTAFRFSRMGTLRMSSAFTSPWWLVLDHNFGGGSSGALVCDYVLLCPARRRAASASGKVLDANYPPFLSSGTTGVSRLIRSNLSGATTLSGLGWPSPGLCGAPLELPPGDVDLALKLSSLVPDDPSASTATEKLSYAVEGSVRITPRTYLFAP